MLNERSSFVFADLNLLFAIGKRGDLPYVACVSCRVHGNDGLTHQGCVVLHKRHDRYDVDTGANVLLVQRRACVFAELCRYKSRCNASGSSSGSESIRMVKACYSECLRLVRCQLFRSFLQAIVITACLFSSPSRIASQLPPVSMCTVRRLMSSTLAQLYLFHCGCPEVHVCSNSYLACIIR